MKTNSFGQEVTREMEISALQNEVKHKVEEIHNLLAQLAAANATLDALREAVRTGFNNQEVAQRVLEALYLQPQVAP